MPDEIVVADVTRHPLIVVRHHVVELILRQVYIILTQHVTEMSGCYTPTVTAVITPKLSLHLLPVFHYRVTNPQHRHVELITGQTRRQLKQK